MDARREGMLMILKILKCNLQFLTNYLTSQTDELNDLLYLHKLKECIKENENYQHVDKTPIQLHIYKKEITNYESKLKYYSVPLKYKEEVNRLLEQDIIEKHRSKYASLSFLIEKRNKELRLVVDYGEVNEYLIDEISVGGGLKF